jgi:hypothetical protein
LGRVSPGVGQSIYSYILKNAKGIWSSYYGGFKTKVINCLTKMLS